MAFVTRVLLLTSAISVACGVRTYAQSDAAILGLWQSTTDLSAPLRGTLVVSESAGTWKASIANRTSAFEVRGRSVRFAFPRDAGEFRGRLLDEGRIEGFWIQPASGTGQPFASPLTLHPREGHRWTATVHPLEARFTLYLRVFQRGDGTLAGAFRNPQGNSDGGATQFRVARDQDHVIFSAGPAGTPDEIRMTADMLTSPERLRLFWKDVNARIDLQRATPAEAAAFYPRPPHDPPYVYRQPPTTADGWTTSRAADVGVDEALLARIVQTIASADPSARRPWLIQSLLVAYRGKLILEEYFYGFTRDEVHDLRSAGKTFASVMLGAAMMRGVAIAPESKVYDILSPIGPFDNPDPRKSQITLAALMTHTSGLACDDNDDKSPGNEDVMQGQSRQPNWWKYTLDLPMAYSPGVRYAYCSGGMNLVGGALTATTQTWLPALFDETIARPLQFGRYYWNLMPTYDGYLGGGAYVLPRDFLKVGQAYLNGGVWNGTRIVNEAWIRDSTAPRVPITEATTGLSAQQFPQFYIASPGDGYAWHSNDLHYGERVFHAYQATGNGGQLLVVVPAVQLSVVITAGNYGEGGIWNKYPQQLIGDGIIPAILCVKGGQC